jgi:hypothetical protein
MLVDLDFDIRTASDFGYWLVQIGYCYLMERGHW